jgi:hypothetical protein
MSLISSVGSENPRGMGRCAKNRVNHMQKLGALGGAMTQHLAEQGVQKT